MKWKLLQTQTLLLKYLKCYIPQYVKIHFWVRLPMTILFNLSALLLYSVQFILISFLVSNLKIIFIFIYSFTQTVISLRIKMGLLTYLLHLLWEVRMKEYLQLGYLLHFKLLQEPSNLQMFTKKTCLNLLRYK